ncbi:MAG TPA: ABC transporter permease [Acidimicrobiales bacterium]|nr:ABC transporter permease [Acidimicrobiales bacterium]
MSTTTATIPIPLVGHREPAAAPSALRRLRRAVGDSLAITERNLIGFVRVPESLFFLSVQPIMFVLLFRYVFGGAIRIPGVDYTNYLMPGIFVQTAAFGSISTAVGMAEDLQKGLIERFRALPMARSAVMAGRSLADLCRAMLVIVIMTGVGFAVGFRPHGGVLGFFAGIGILLLFAQAMSWGFSLIGLTAPNSETAQVMAFPVIFPLTFASSAFVAIPSLPSWLQPFARNQPVSQIINAVRDLMLGNNVHVPTVLLTGGSTSHAAVLAVLWCLGLVAVLAPAAVRRYRRAV